MIDLRARFGSLVRAHRLSKGWTQEALAERASISTDMVSKLEGGNTGARFAVISKLADALEIDPAELFTPNLPAGEMQRSALTDITTRLAGLSDGELKWLSGIIDAATRSRSS